jgi:hypothetical protein
MVKLKDILIEQSADDLKDVARRNYIRGFSGLRKDELIDLILKTTKEAVWVEKYTRKLSPSARLMLAHLVSTFKGEAKNQDLIIKVSETYSEKTAMNAGNAFYGSVVVFDKENGTRAIPSDVIPALSVFANDQLTNIVTPTKPIPIKQNMLLPDETVKGLTLDFFLQDLIADELKDLCRSNDVRGYSSARKDEILNLLKHVYPDDESLIKRVRHLSDTQKGVLRLLARKPAGVAETDSLEDEFRRERENCNFGLIVGHLNSLLLVFSYEPEDDQPEIMVIPRDFYAGVLKVLGSNSSEQPRLPIEKKEPDPVILEIGDTEESEDEVAREINSPVDILTELGKRDLAAFCDGAGIPKSGNKEQIVERILNAGFPLTKVLGIASKPILRDACKNLGLTLTGRKPDFVEYLVTYFEKSHSNNPKASNQRTNEFDDPIKPIIRTKPTDHQFDDPETKVTEQDFSQLVKSIKKHIDFGDYDDSLKALKLTSLDQLKQENIAQFLNNLGRRPLKILIQKNNLNVDQECSDLITIVDDICGIYGIQSPNKFLALTRKFADLDPRNKAVLWRGVTQFASQELKGAFAQIEAGDKTLGQKMRKSFLDEDLKDPSLCGAFFEASVFQSLRQMDIGRNDGLGIKNIYSMMRFPNYQDKDEEQDGCFDITFNAINNPEGKKTYKCLYDCKSSKDEYHPIIFFDKSVRYLTLEHNKNGFRPIRQDIHYFIIFSSKFSVDERIYEEKIRSDSITSKIIFVLWDAGALRYIIQNLSDDNNLKQFLPLETLFTPVPGSHVVRVSLDSAKTMIRSAQNYARER